MPIYDGDSDQHRSPRSTETLKNLAVLFTVLLVIALASWIFYGSLHDRFGVAPSSVPKQSAPEPYPVSPTPPPPDATTPK